MLASLLGAIDADKDNNQSHIVKLNSNNILDGPH